MIDLASRATGLCPLCCVGNFTDWRLSLLKCRRCGLIVSPSVWQPAANEVLNDAFFGENYEPLPSFWVRWFERSNNRRTLERLRFFRRPQGGRLLELGVGSGSLLSAAKIDGYAPVGCDLSPAVCSAVERRTGVDVHCGPLASLADDRLFDVIIMNHVLEHVAEPLVLLEAARKRLRPGGLLHLAVPNIDAWEAALAGWNSYEPYHLLYFTPTTLRAAAEKAGFEIQCVATHESFSGWFLALVRTLLPRQVEGHQRSRQVPTRPVFLVEHAYRIAMVGCGALSLPFRRFQQSLGKGDEVVLVGKHATHP